MFAHNFIIKCCVSSKDRFWRSTEVTRRLMLHQKNPNGSPKVSSSSQLLLVNFRKRVWVWTFATCFIPNFKFPPLLSRKRFKACVLQVFWTNWGFSKCLKWHWSYPFKTKIWSFLEKTWIFAKFFNTLLKEHLIKRCRNVKTKVFMYGWSFDIISKRNMTSSFNQFRKSRLLFFVTSVQVSILFVLKVWKMILTTLSTSKWLSNTTFKKTQNMKETYNHHDLLKMMKS